MTENNIKLSDYIQKNIVIPAYQRGYVWGKKDKNREKDSVTFLLKDLIQSYNKDKQKKFLQAVTVYEEADEINIVDGQQRTIFFYLLLTYLDNKNQPFKLTYKTRNNSNTFLNKKCTEFIESLKNGFLLNESEKEFKDIYFFKKTLEIFYKSEPLKSIDNKDDFKTYILNNIYFLYLPIKKDHVKTTFTMMNGNKAIMHSDELIKAEILRLISIDESNVIVNRARVAKEWERWVQWWNRSDVKSIFHIKDSKSNDKLKELINIMSNNKNQNLYGKDLFLFFKLKYLINKENAINTFNELRLVQKKFEDIYNDPIIYNKTGLILNAFNTYDVLFYILNNYKTDKFNKLYYLSALKELKVLKWNDIKEYLDKPTHSKNIEYISLYQYCQNILEKASYSNESEFIFFFLLLLNIEEDNKLNRKFDFSITNEQSIEHIYPQNSFKNNKDNSISENNGNSIGNLVLLYGNENSSLNNNDFEVKKILFFNYNNEGWFKRSIHLLDTVKEFSKTKWGKDEIEQRQNNITAFFEKNYYQFKDFMIKDK